MDSHNAALFSEAWSTPAWHTARSHAIYVTLHIVLLLCWLCFSFGLATMWNFGHEILDSDSYSTDITTDLQRPLESAQKILSIPTVLDSSSEGGRPYLYAASHVWGRISMTNFRRMSSLLIRSLSVWSHGESRMLETSGC